jgi:hypothetical protein
VANLNELSNTLTDVANRMQNLADNALPAANRIAGLIRVGGVLGLVGGVLGAIGLALPGFGLARSWPFFLLLVSIAGLCAFAMFRWAKQLRSWSGDVTHAVHSLKDLPAPAQLVEKLRGGAEQLVPAGKRSGRSNIVALVKAGQELRKRVGELPGAADKAKDLMVQLTGPFRPPFIAMRITLLFGGLFMIFVGPLVALVAAIAK